MNPHCRVHHLGRVPTYLSLAHHYSLSTSPFLDFYSFLEIPPTASPSLILSAWNDAVEAFESDIDNFTDLDLRERTVGLLGTTLKILLHPTERLLYDVYRTMTLGKLNLTKPVHDLPSLHVARIRHRMVWFPLEWILIEVSHTGSRIRVELDDSDWIPDTPLKAKYLIVVETLRSFIQHVTGIQQVMVAMLQLLSATTESEWDECIRDLTLNEHGLPTNTRRSTLLYLKAVEDGIHAKFWLKIAEAAAAKFDELDDEYVPADDIDRIIEVLSHLRY